MKVGVITKPNTKGQIVIPKEFRRALDINKDDLLNLVIRGNGIYIYPVSEMVPKIETKSAYLKVLERTRGSWQKDASPLNKQKRNFELSASRKRKKVW